LRASLLGMPRPVLDDRYAIEKVLGRGVSGVVVRARDERLARDVAIKLTPASAASQRMLDEARALAQLRRPDCVVQVWEATRGRLASSCHAGELYYIVMELVVGVTLREWQARDRTWPQILNVYGNVAVGLARVHSAGIAHGDVKPDNVIVDAEGVPTLVDFGFAANVGTEDDGFFEALSESLTSRVGGAPRRSRDVVGTPPYMAPEVRKGDIRRESDVHAFAVSLWEALIGTVPFHGEQAPTRWLSVAALPGEEHIPRALRKALKNAMQPEPWGRPSIVDVHAQVVQAGQELSRQPTRWGLWLVVLVSLGLLGVAGMLAVTELFSAGSGGNSVPGVVPPLEPTPPEIDQLDPAPALPPQPVPTPASTAVDPQRWASLGTTGGDSEAAACAALPSRWEVAVWVTNPETGQRTTAPDPSSLALRHQGGCRYTLVVDGETAPSALTLRRSPSGALVGTALAAPDAGYGIRSLYRVTFQGTRVTGHVEMSAEGTTVVVFSFAGAPVR
jgi:serine/threonine protein kinase